MQEMDDGPFRGTMPAAKPTNHLSRPINGMQSPVDFETSLQKGRIAGAREGDGTIAQFFGDISGAQSRNRTSDTRIFNRSRLRGFSCGWNGYVSFVSLQ
jgi:hypothetical protein